MASKGQLLNCRASGTGGASVSASTAPPCAAARPPRRHTAQVHLQLVGHHRAKADAAVRQSTPASSSSAGAVDLAGFAGHPLRSPLCPARPRCVSAPAVRPSIVTRSTSSLRCSSRQQLHAQRGALSVSEGSAPNPAGWSAAPARPPAAPATGRRSTSAPPAALAPALSVPSLPPRCGPCSR